MEDLGNWVYILLMVVVGISSLLSSINKKKGQQQTQMPDSEFPDLSFPEVPVPVPMEKSKKAPDRFPEHRKYQPLRSHSTFPVTDSSVQTEISIASEKENTLADELDLTDDEAFRKAIIYSEIINRKY